VYPSQQRGDLQFGRLPFFVYGGQPMKGDPIMNREILEKSFGPEQIKQREGNFGKMLDYIEGHAVSR